MQIASPSRQPRNSLQKRQEDPASRGAHRPRTTLQYVRPVGLKNSVLDLMRKKDLTVRNQPTATVRTRIGSREPPGRFPPRIRLDRNRLKRHLTQQTSQSVCNTLQGLEEYDISADIGKGSYATVKSAMHRTTKRQVALKIYETAKLDTTRQRNLDREVDVLRKLDHPNVVKLYEVIHTQTQVVLVMELVVGKSLQELLKQRPQKRLSEADAKTCFASLIEAVAYCHSKSVCHRDIKLDNILVDERGQLKLIDFGFARCEPLETKGKFFCGTPSYMAPEIVERTEHCAAPADLWACGIVLYMLLNGRFPFQSFQERDLFKKIAKAEFVMTGVMPVEVQLVVKQLLARRPESRLTAEELLACDWVSCHLGQNTSFYTEGSPEIFI